MQVGTNSSILTQGEKVMNAGQPYQSPRQRVWAAKPNDGVIYFKDAHSMKTEETTRDTGSETKIQRWIHLDQKIKRDEELNETDKTFWEFFQTSKKFGELEEEDAELKSYLAQRQG